MLAASSVAEAPTVEVAPAETLAQEHEVLSITAVHVRVGDKVFTVRSKTDIVPVTPGQELQVIGVDYRLRDGETLEGKVAFEGYLRKVSNKGTSAFDYRDGRQGKSVQNGEIPEGVSSHPGLRSGWTMESGYERLLIAMVRYNGNGPIVEDRVSFRIQVAKTDFEMTKVKLRPDDGLAVAGKEIRLYGGWRNLEKGRVKDYAEVDIYHESDRRKLVWVGSFTRVANGNGIAKGEFTQRYNKFSERWTPDRAGTYTLKFYADPEDRWVEENEDNNVIVVKIKVFNTSYEARRAGQHTSVWKWWSPESKPDKRYAAVRSRPRMVLRASFASHLVYSLFSQQRVRKTESPRAAPKANEVDAAFGSGFGSSVSDTQITI